MILLMAEIQRSPVEVGSFFTLFSGFYTSQVVQDFFHQQYYMGSFKMIYVISDNTLWQPDVSKKIDHGFDAS